MQQTNTAGLKNCGLLFRQLRIEKNLSLSELVMRLGPGWDKSRLSKIETNQLPISRNVIHQIAAALEIRPEPLLLMCLKQHYPGLQDSRVGELLDEIAAILSED